MFSYLEAKEISKNLLHDLIDNYGFDIFLSKPSNKVFYEWKREVESFLPSTLSFLNGATKAVIVIEEADFVIKIPFLHNWRGGSSENFCEIELDIYEKAKQNKEISECFASVCFGGKVCNAPFYLMEKVSVDEEYNSDTIYSFYEDIGYSHSEVINEAEEDGVRLLFESFYPDVFSSLEEFIDEHEINDLHTGNFGFLNGRPVFIDYSGY